MEGEPPRKKYSRKRKVDGDVFLFSDFDRRLRKFEGGVDTPADLMNVTSRTIKRGDLTLSILDPRIFLKGVNIDAIALPDKFARSDAIAVPIRTAPDVSPFAHCSFVAIVFPGDILTYDMRDDIRTRLVLVNPPSGPRLHATLVRSVTGWFRKYLCKVRERGNGGPSHKEIVDRIRQIPTSMFPKLPPTYEDWEWTGGRCVRALHEVLARMNRDDDVSEPFLKLERTDKDGTQHVRKIANTIDACDGCEDEGPSVSPGICVKKEPADWRCTGGRAVGAAVGGSGGQAAAPAIDNGVDVRATRGGASGAAGGRNADHVAGVAANAARRQKGSGRAKPEHAVASSAPQDTVEQTRGGDAGRINTQKLLANTEQGLLTVLPNHGERIRNLEATNQAMKSMVIACIESIAKTLSGLGEDLKSQHPRPPPYPTTPHPGSQGNENVGLCRQAGKDVRNEVDPGGGQHANDRKRVRAEGAGFKPTPLHDSHPPVPATPQLARTRALTTNSPCTPQGDSAATRTHRRKAPVNKNVPATRADPDSTPPPFTAPQRKRARSREGKPAGMVSAPTPPKCPPADGELPQASASLKRGRFDRECMPPLALAQQLIRERSTCGGAQQDVCGTEGPGAEAGAGAGGRAGGDTEKKGVSDEGTPRAVDKGGLCTVGEEHARNEVETQAGGRRADDAGMASAGGAEERAVCAGEEAKEVKSTEVKGISQVGKEAWTAFAVLDGKYRFLGSHGKRESALYVHLMARTVFGEQVDIGGLRITSSKAAWEADRNKARLISPGLWAVMHGHGLTSIMAGYRAVLEGFTADEGDEESAQLAICAAIGTAAANFEKRSGATAKVFAPALAASCAAVWSIWRGVRTNCAVDRAVAAAKAVGAEQSQLAHCKDVITAVLNTLGNRSHERREEAKSDPDGHVAWVIEQALGGPGLATSDDAKVVAKEMTDTLGMWSACTVAAGPLVETGFDMPQTAEMKRKCEIRAESWLGGLRPTVQHGSPLSAQPMRPRTQQGSPLSAQPMRPRTQQGSPLSAQHMRFRTRQLNTNLPLVLNPCAPEPSRDFP
ncbi:unnamed protein product [Closterium sp. Naga37s-1]|nr:unnamed protein product [Closterium sp. Naga37s-1]